MNKRKHSEEKEDMREEGGEGEEEEEMETYIRIEEK